jgi:hypothetical protein
MYKFFFQNVLQDHPQTTCSIVLRFLCFGFADGHYFNQVLAQLQVLWPIGGNLFPSRGNHKKWSIVEWVNKATKKDLMMEKTE